VRDGRPADAPAPDARAPLADAAPDGSLDFCARANSAPSSDGCGVAPDLSTAARQPGGVTVYGSTRGYSDHVNPAIIATCTGAMEPGPDALYRVDAGAGRTVRLTLLTVDWDAAVYLLDGCSRSAPCLGGSDQRGVGARETFNRMVSGGTYYVVVDGSAMTAAGCYALTVEVL
jgi:hypothetical protein